MDPQLSQALIALAVVIIGALGALIAALTERIKRDLATNTELTREAKEASNGRMSEMISQLAAERDRSLALREIVREREDRIAYLTARVPEAERILVGYRERRATRIAPIDELVAEQRFLAPDDPTGTDAGAHPRG